MDARHGMYSMGLAKYLQVMALLWLDAAEVTASTRLAVTSMGAASSSAWHGKALSAPP